MLKNWNPAKISSNEEVKNRLKKSRDRLYELQIKIKEHKLPVLVLCEGWGALQTVRIVLKSNGNHGRGLEKS